MANRGSLMIATILFTIASVTDFLDGYLARRYNTITTLGAFIDPFADKILVLCLLFSFYTLGAIKLWVLLVIALRDIAITLLRILSLIKGYELTTTRSAKLKTAFQFAIIYLLFLLASNKLDSMWYSVIENMMYGIVAFTVWTGISYIIANKHIIKKIF